MALVNPWMTALQAALGGASGYLSGRAEEKEDEEKRRRLAEQDKMAKDAAALAHVAAGVNPYTEGMTLGEDEQLVTLPSGVKVRLGPTPTERVQARKEKAAQAALDAKIARDKEAWRKVPGFEKFSDSELEGFAAKGPPGPEYLARTPQQLAESAFNEKKLAAEIAARKAGDQPKGPKQEDLDEAEAAWNDPALRNNMADEFNAMRARGDKRAPQVLMLAAWNKLKAKGNITEDLGGTKKPAANLVTEILSGRTIGGGNPAAIGTPSAPVAPAQAAPATPVSASKTPVAASLDTASKKTAGASEEETMKKWIAANPPTRYGSQKEYYDAFYRDHPEFKR